jgi:hypothetical protein
MCVAGCGCDLVGATRPKRDFKLAFSFGAAFTTYAIFYRWVSK